MNLDKFSDSELAKAIELMISPSDLIVRNVAIAILREMKHTSDDIIEVLADGEHLNPAESMFINLQTATPQIMNI